MKIYDVIKLGHERLTGYRSTFGVQEISFLCYQKHTLCFLAETTAVIAVLDYLNVVCFCMKALLTDGYFCFSSQ